MIEPKRIDDEQWFIDLEERLGEYKKNKSKVKVLRIQLLKDVSPDAKLIASYAEGGGKGHEEISPKEIELLDLEQEVAMIDAALEGLKDDPKNIIILRFIEGVRDWHIYDIKIRMAKSTYYGLRNSGMVQMAETLGILDSNRTPAEPLANHNAIK